MGKKETPVVLVPPRLLSQALGQKRKNLTELQRRWPGLTIRADAEIKEDFLILYRDEEREEKQGGVVCG